MPRLTSCVQPQRIVGYIAGLGTAALAIWGTGSDFFKQPEFKCHSKKFMY